MVLLITNLLINKKGKNESRRWSAWGGKEIGGSFPVRLGGNWKRKEEKEKSGESGVTKEEQRKEFGIGCRL